MTEHKGVLVMILCGGKGERLYPLTRDRAKPSVPFLGTYRIIDFSLSNALNSGLRRIALLTQYKSLSLERHIFYGWNIFHAESGDFVISLSAQGRVGDRSYEGTADAIFQNIYTIQQENPEVVLVLSGDHVYTADYRGPLEFMARTRADAVILSRLVPLAEGSRFGVLGVDAERRIVEFAEKPRKPAPAPGNPGACLISMGVYLFRTSPLIRALLRDARRPESAHDFGKDVIPALLAGVRVLAYPFDGYWEDIGTLDAYWEANMAFLGPKPPLELKDPAWPVRTHKPQYPPTYIHEGEVRNSVLGEGCVLDGCRVEDSIVSSGVRFGAGAEVAGSILLEGVAVGPGVKLRRVIADKGAAFPAGLRVGFDDEADARLFKISRGGVRVVPKNWTAE
jgi:glucose-1-phosphate adenylyltransferase